MGNSPTGEKRPIVIVGSIALQLAILKTIEAHLELVVLRDEPPPMPTLEFKLHASDIDADPRPLMLKERPDARTYQKINWKVKRREKRRKR